MRAPVYALIATLAVTGACESSTGDLPVDPDGDVLGTVSDALVDALAEVGAFSVTPSTFAAARTANDLAAQVSPTFPVDRSTECPAGGTTRLQGSVSRNANTPTTYFSGTLTNVLRDCETNVHRGRRFTLNADGITQTVSVRVSPDGATAVDLSYRGAIRWSATSGSIGGGGGTCGVDLSAAVDITPSGERTAIVAGMLCRQGVNTTFTR